MASDLALGQGKLLITEHELSCVDHTPPRNAQVAHLILSSECLLDLKLPSCP